MGHYLIYDKWVPVTTAWHVLGLQMEEQPPIWWGKKNSPFTGLEWPMWSQEDKFPRFHDNGAGWW